MHRSGLVLVAAAFPLAWIACQGPTAVRAIAYTEVPCDTQAPVAVVVASDLAELNAKLAAGIVSSTRAGCSGGLVGDLVVTPPGANDGPIAFALLTRADGQTPDRCGDPTLGASDRSQCIVAKRALRFRSHEQVDVRVDLRGACRGIACGAEQTCVKGTCVSAQVASVCAGTCTETDLTVGDAGVAPGLCDPLPPPTGHVVEVSDVASLVAAVSGASPNDTILIADGTYSLTGAPLLIEAEGVTLRSKSGKRDAVVLDGGYDPGAGAMPITIHGSHVTVASLTVQRAYYHPIHVASLNADIKGTLLYDLHVIDPAEQAIMIHGDPAFTHFADDGVVACSKIELTAAGRAQVRNNCFTGGVDAHAARGWTVRDNWIEGFYCSAGLAEHAVHFWRGSRDTTVERNVIRDNVRGIGLGLGQGVAGRSYADQPCGGAANMGSYGGIVRNNAVSAQAPELFGSQSGFDTGIGLEESCEAVVVHNSVASTQPPGSSSLEVRFAATRATVTNNLLSAAFKVRDGAASQAAGNVEQAPLSLFRDVPAGDLHVTIAAAPRGIALPSGLADRDIDGDARAIASPAVGADEP